MVPISKVRFKNEYTRKRGWEEILVTDPPLFSEEDKTYYKKLIINWNGNNITVPHSNNVINKILNYFFNKKFVFFLINYTIAYKNYVIKFVVSLTFFL